MKRQTKCLRLAVEATPNAMIMSNQEGKIILVNSCAEALFGYKRQELLGQPIEILLTEASRMGHQTFGKTFWANRGHVLGDTGGFARATQGWHTISVEIS